MLVGLTPPLYPVLRLTTSAAALHFFSSDVAGDDPEEDLAVTDIKVWLADRW